MCARPAQHGGFAWLEILAVFAAIVLLFQAFPSLGPLVLQTVDFTKWTRPTWLLINVAVVLALFGARFSPALYEEWANRRTRISREREKQDKQRQLKEQRETLERLQRGRERRIY